MIESILAVFAAESATPAIIAATGWALSEVIGISKNKSNSVAQLVCRIASAVLKSIKEENADPPEPVPTPAPSTPAVNCPPTPGHLKEAIREEQEVVKQQLPKPPVVPYYSQNDNKSGTGYRECFSSAVAMMLGAFHPDLINSDDEYIKARTPYGDTTQVAAHRQCLLEKYGLESKFTATANQWALQEALEKGPVAIGILHRGPATNPTRNSGHWVLVKSYNKGGKYYVVNDPYGGYTWRSGKHNKAKSGEDLEWPIECLQARWTADGPYSGWMLSLV